MSKLEAFRQGEMREIAGKRSEAAEITMEPGSAMLPMHDSMRCPILDVEQEVHYVAVLDDIFLALSAHLASFLCALLAFVSNEIFV